MGIRFHKRVDVSTDGIRLFHLVTQALFHVDIVSRIVRGLQTMKVVRRRSWGYDDALFQDRESLFILRSLAPEIGSGKYRVRQLSNGKLTRSVDDYRWSFFHIVIGDSTPV